ncbi:GntR family transcriptional regulator [Rhodococcus sp. C3V]|uniref:GntR family transcriptional regulator n=1 Tax=Rhodococcus sp. C3V TaxID=3034165 RepID=UPI0023E125F8|nr:GntR family transcriptional regulator [Rhodococcus sp. C3V]MDF3319992.1 GntR family transcriptional regulator [Rhodococcus sp. C3V]
MAHATQQRGTPSLGASVADSLRTSIIDGKFELGEALSEDAVAEALGVSRTPVREAMRLLQLQGLVTIVPKSGTYVFQPTEDEIAELCEFRATLEIRAAALSFGRNRGSTLKDLRYALDDMDRARPARDSQGYGKADTCFHEAFFDNCGNRYLQNAYRMNLTRVAALRTHLTFLSPSEPERSFAEHEAMATIFDSGNEEDIEPLLQTHIMRTREMYLLALQERRRVKTGSKAEQMRRKLTAL